MCGGRTRRPIGQDCRPGSADPGPSHAAAHHHAIQGQQDDGPQDRHEEAGGLVLTVEPERPSDEAADERTRDAQQYRDDEPPGIAPGINSLAITPTTRPNRIHNTIPIRSSSLEVPRCKRETNSY